MKRYVPNENNGELSRADDVSSPITCMGALQQGQLVSSGTIVTSTRGRWAGSAPRLVRRRSPRARAPLGLSCRRRPRCRQWLARYPRAPEAAARDRASPIAGRIAHAAIGAGDAAGDQSAKAHDRAPRSRRHAPHAPPRPAHAALQYPQQAVRSRSRAALNQIRARL